MISFNELILSFIIILIISSCSSSKMISEDELIRKNYQEIFDIEEIDTNDENKPKLDQHAMYPNGLNGIFEHVAKTTRYPRRAFNNNIQGRVLVEFIVETDGRVKEAYVIESVSRNLDEEAIRVILALDRFYPGFKDGKPVRVSYKQPIVFRLN